MDHARALADRSMHQMRTIGASVPLRLALLGAALLANVPFYLPSLPAETDGFAAVPGLDKVVHAGVFALTVWAAGRVLAPQRRFPIGWVVIIALVHAVLIELVQMAMPGRSASIWDILADAVGIALGVIAWRFEQRRALSPRS